MAKDHGYKFVATAPTVYGIETRSKRHARSKNIRVATAPTVYGIETNKRAEGRVRRYSAVATAPTVYGIETIS